MPAERLNLNIGIRYIDPGLSSFYFQFVNEMIVEKTRPGYAFERTFSPSGRFFAVRRCPNVHIDSVKPITLRLDGLYSIQ